LLQEHSGETLPPTQFGLFCVLAALLATFLGMILPSSKADDFSVKTSAASALSVAKLESEATIITPISIPIVHTPDLPRFQWKFRREESTHGGQVPTLKKFLRPTANSIFYATWHHPALLNIDPA
jgi:hypothetical protein